MRKILGLIGIVFLFAGWANIKAAEKEIPIKVITEQGETLELPLLLVNGMGYLDVADLGRIFAGKVNYSVDRQKVSVLIGNKEIRLFVNSRRAVLNHQIKTMGKITLRKQEKIFVPLELILTRDFGILVDCYVKWSFTKRLLLVQPRYNIKRVYTISEDTFTLLGLEFTQPLVPEITRPENNRILIEIDGGNLNVLDNTFTVQDGVIQNVVANREENRSILLLNLGPLAGSQRVFRQEEPPSVKIIIEKMPRSQPLTGLVSFTTMPLISTPSFRVLHGTKPVKTVRTSFRKLKLETIVVDPGHGGKDPGAIGPRGTKEKDIVLNIAKYLASYLRKRLKVKVFLTRDKDVFVPLNRRAEFANKVKADLFISIHANAHLSSQKQGFEIFFLSEKASDAEAQAVANRENAVLNLEAPKQQQDMLNRILWSMVLNEYMNESSRLCALIAKNVEKQIKALTNRGTRQANFYVLRGAKMPAVLVETAFISNPLEEKLLKKTSFQKQIASAIVDGVEEYKNYLKAFLEK